MYINNKHVVYNGWKEGMLYIGDAYGGHYGTKNARYFVVWKEGFV